MANITFSSPSMARDVTVYAVAGDRGTVLAVSAFAVWRAAPRQVRAVAGKIARA